MPGHAATATLAPAVDGAPDGVEIVPVTGPALLDRFVRLPERLYASDPQFIPPLRMERKAALTPSGNPYFEHAEVALWLARREGRDVGRISAQIDRLSPDDGGPPAGQFGLLAAEDDPAVFAALTRTAEDWLRARGRGRMFGPLNLSTNEEVGLLVDGFDTPPMVLTPHDAPHIGPQLEALGYGKARDVLGYLCDAQTDLPPAVRRRVDRGPPPGVRLRPLDMRRYDAEVATLTGILNDAWSGNWGFVPTTEAETRALAKALKDVIDPRLVWFGEIDGEAAGVVVYLPNINEAIRDLRGRLLPFGWAKLLWRLKVTRVKSLRVPLMGVKRRFHRDRRGQMLPFLMIDAAGRRALRLGYDRFELSWVLEDNAAMNAIAVAMGGRVYKRWRVYEKALA